jgi:hypothetical protein
MNKLKKSNLSTLLIISLLTLLCILLGQQFQMSTIATDSTASERYLLSSTDNHNRHHLFPTITDYHSRGKYKKGFLYVDGTVAIPPRYENISTFRNGLAIVHTPFTKLPKYFMGDYDVYPFGMGQVIDIKGSVFLRAKENEYFQCQNEGYLMKLVVDETFQILNSPTNQQKIYSRIVKNYKGSQAVPTQRPNSLHWIFYYQPLDTLDTNGHDSFENISIKVVNLATKKEIAIPREIKFSSCFSQGLAAVGVGIEPGGDNTFRAKKNGYIDKNGKVVIPLQYDRVWDFQSNGFAQVMKNNKLFFIDRQGRKVSDVVGKTTFSEGLAVRYDLSGEQTSQVINAKNQVVFTLPKDLKFHHDNPKFTSGLILVCNTAAGRCGYVNRQGKVTIDPQFSYATPFEQGLAEVITAAGHAAYINTKGDIVWQNLQSVGQ